MRITYHTAVGRSGAAGGATLTPGASGGSQRQSRPGGGSSLGVPSRFSHSASGRHSSENSFDPFDAPLRALCKLVLPNAHNTPALPSQLRPITTVAHNVAGQLCIPIASTRMGATVTFRAAMPEAAVHKHRESLAGEDEVWLAGQVYRLIPPTSHASRHQCRPQFALGGAGVLRANSRHNPRAVEFVYNVHQRVCCSLRL